MTTSAHSNCFVWAVGLWVLHGFRGAVVLRPRTEAPWVHAFYRSPSGRTYRWRPNDEHAPFWGIWWYEGELVVHEKEP